MDRVPRSSRVSMLTPGTPAEMTLSACRTNVDRDGGRTDNATSDAAAADVTGSAMDER
jgi:hypothetical protein